MKTLRFFPLLGLLLVLLVGPSTTEAQEGFSDSFHSSSVDDTLWAVNIQGIGSVDPQTDGLHMTLTSDNDAPTFAVSVNSLCKVQGDFDAEVEYHLTIWPPANGIRLGLGAGGLAVPAWMERVSETDGRELYLTHMADGGHVTETTQIAGRLRLTRTGDTLAGRFYSSGSWILLHSHSDPQYTGDAFIGLQIWGHNSTPGVEVVLENFSVTADGVTGPCGPFTPTYSETADEIAPDDFTVMPIDDECPVSAPCKMLYAEDIPDGQPSGLISVLAPSSIQQFAGDAIIPDGAIIGHVFYSRRSTDQPGTCPSTGTIVSSEWDFLEGTTNATTTTGSPSDLYSFSNWPIQLNDFRDTVLAAYPGSLLHSRWVKPSPDGPNNLLVFKLADGSLLYWVAPVGDPTLPPSQDCGPITIRYVALGVTADNPATPQDEGGIPLVTCAAPGTQTYTLSLDRDDTPESDPVVLEDTTTCSANTPAGSGVYVPLNGGTGTLAGMDVTFSEIAAGGSTTVVTTTAGPPPPTGFKIVGLAELPLYFDINTDASYSGDLTVCVRYDETQVEGAEENLKLMQRVDDDYADTTTSVDTVNDIICGTTSHLSIFVVAQTAPTPTPTPTPGPPAVGGIIEMQVDGPGSPASLASGSGPSSPPYTALITLAAAALATLTAGAWYARRRWSR